MVTKSKPQHRCQLPIKDTSGLPRLPPNAHWTQKFCRCFRKYFLMDPGHHMCKKMFRNMSSILAEKKRHAKSGYPYVIHPFSKMNTILKVIFFITWYYTFVCEPMMIYSSNHPLWFKTIQTHGIFPIRLFIICTFFFVGYVDEKNKVVIIEPKKIVWRYVRTFFVIDLLSTCLLTHITYALTVMGYMNCSFSFFAEGHCAEIVYMIRIVCTWMRMNTLLSFLHDCLKRINCPRGLRYMMIYTVRTFMFILFSAFTVYFVPYFLHRGDWPPNSWLHQAGIHHTDNDALTHFLESFLMAVCYFFGINYRYDVDLMSEQICVLMATISGRMYTLYLMADVLNMFGIATLSESKYERQKLMLNEYILSKKLPDSLRQRMTRFYEFKFQKRYFNEEKIINTLSENLRVELFLFSAKKLTAKVNLFKKLPRATLGAMIASMKVETYAPRDVILKPGDDANEIYFISSGTVAVIDRSGKEMCHLDDGDDFGTIGLILKGHIFSVMAVETTEVFCVPKGKFLELLAPFPDMRANFFRNGKDRLVRLRALEKHSNIDNTLISDLNSGGVLAKRTRKIGR